MPRPRSQLKPKPLATPIGAFPATIAQENEKIVLKENILSLSGDSFEIRNSNGVPLLKVQRRHATLSDRKSVCGMDGKPIFHLVKEHFHLHATYAAKDVNERSFLKMKSSFKFFGSKVTGTFNSANGQKHIFTMRGNWLHTRATIVLDSGATKPVVGLIDRKIFNAREILGGQQTYAVEVAKGMDIALVVAFCVVLDEQTDKKKKRAVLL